MAFLLAALALALAPVSTDTTALAVMAEVERLAAASLWPGFDPRQVPVAIFDGERTLLFGHPAPPADFVALPGRPGVRAYPGHHPAIRANTSVELAGTRTATVLLDPGARRPLAALAALVVHETFHVHQRERHPTWSANEAELFVYPVEDAGLLALRRLETEALRQAMDAADAVGAACRARAALERRAERFARMPEGAVAYERGNELQEGLAQYVERRAAAYLRGRARGPTDAAASAAAAVPADAGAASPLPAAGFAPEAVRLRSYAAGEVLALLLDRFDPGWKEKLEAGDPRALDEILAAALPGARPECAPSVEERAAAGERARRDVEALVAARQTRRQEFLAAPGWRIEVVADPAPLWLQGFDPLNVSRLGAGEVLHARWIKLGNEAGELEVLGRASLTTGVGAHPLFQGVRHLVVTGLSAAPGVQVSEGMVSVEGEGVKLRLRGAEVQRGERVLTLRLRAGS